MNLTISLKNGDTKHFTKPVRTVNKIEEPSHVHLSSLHENILLLQKESNMFLTTVVEKEKAEMQANQSEKRTSKGMGNGYTHILGVNQLSCIVFIDRAMDTSSGGIAYGAHGVTTV